MHCGQPLSEPVGHLEHLGIELHHLVTTKRPSTSFLLSLSIRRGVEYNTGIANL